MRLHLNRQTPVNAPAERAWHVLAHEFSDISIWSSAIAESYTNPEAAVMAGAELGGRVCVAPGFGETHENLTHYNEKKMRFSYSATIKGMPAVRQAINHWAVIPQGEHSCIVESRAEILLATFPGIFLAPFVVLAMKRLGKHSAEELRYYIENGKPHPRVLKQSQQQIARTH